MEDTDLVHGRFMGLADDVLISLLELCFKDLTSMLGVGDGGESCSSIGDLPIHFVPALCSKSVHRPVILFSFNIAIGE